MKRGIDICRICGKELKEFDVIDPETGNKVATEVACPDEWNESHNRART